MNGTKDTVVALMLASAKEATSSTVGGTDLSDKVSSDRQIAVVGRDNHQSRAKSTGPSLLLNSASLSMPREKCARVRGLMGQEVCSWDL